MAPRLTLLCALSSFGMSASGFDFCRIIYALCRLLASDAFNAVTIQDISTDIVWCIKKENIHGELFRSSHAFADTGPWPLRCHPPSSTFLLISGVNRGRRLSTSLCPICPSGLDWFRQVLPWLQRFTGRTWCEIYPLATCWTSISLTHGGCDEEFLLMECNYGTRHKLCVDKERYFTE